MTSEGIRHRGGEDPHSKNLAAAHSLVAAFYQLPRIKEGDDPACSTEPPAPYGSSIASASVVPLVRSRGVLSRTQTCETGEPHQGSSSAMPVSVILPEGEGRSPTPLASRTSPQHTSGPRNSAVLALKLQCDLLARSTLEQPSSSPSPNRMDTHDDQRSCDGVVSKRTSRAVSAAKADALMASVNAEGGPQRVGPQATVEFPSVVMCRDLNATIALKRAAAVMDRVDGKSSQSAGPTAATMESLRKDLGSSIMHTIRTTNVHQHRIAEQASRIPGGLTIYDVLEGSSSATSLASTLTAKQRAAIVRDVYRFLPRDEVERMTLRDRLESMQTTFAKRDIDADLDSFKHRNAKSKRVGLLFLEKHSQHGSGSGSGLSGGLSSSPSGLSSETAVFDPNHEALWHDLSDSKIPKQQIRRSRSSCERSGKKKVNSYGGDSLGFVSRIYRTTATYDVNDGSSDIPKERRHSTAGQRGPSHSHGNIPAQSRITLNGKVFTYSELFRHPL